MNWVLISSACYFAFSLGLAVGVTTVVTVATIATKVDEMGRNDE
jgi:hypothetical protein